MARQFKPGEIDYSEKRKAMDIITAVNSLYFANAINSKRMNGKTEKSLIFACNDRGSNLMQAIFIPLDSEFIYASPENQTMATINGLKFQKSLGIEGEDYNQPLVRVRSAQYINSIKDEKLKEIALSVWKDNFEYINEISRQYPDSECLRLAVDALEQTDNYKQVQALYPEYQAVNHN